MYIEFQLPTGAGGATAQYTISLIERNLQQWSIRYQIPYVKKLHKWTVRVTFDHEDLYSFFAMTWNPEAEYMLDYVTNYRLIEPMSRV